MRPIKLKMEAFGSYGKETVIDFTKPGQNIFLVTGDTGSGKSTIFDAIVFALYGEASSNSNKKDGKELQSQFVDYNVIPYVELVFSEQSRDSESIYTIRREPIRMGMRPNGKKLQQFSERTELILPDGSMYPEKDIDKKIEEIIGLSKSQFMQVAMIAQGEFMELLRSGTDKKKVVFRKLFNTQIFERIVNKLDEYRKSSESELDTIKTLCSVEISKISIPENYSKSETLKELSQRIINSKKLDITDLEQLVSSLSDLCDTLFSEKDAACKNLNSINISRDKMREEFARAETLIKAYDALEIAQKEYNECIKQSDEVKEMETSKILIENAYETLAAYEKYNEVENTINETEDKLKYEQCLLPEKTERYIKACEYEKNYKEIKDAGIEEYTKIKEKTDKTLEILDKLDVLIKEINEEQKKLNKNLELAEDANKKMTVFENQLKEWNQEANELSGSDVMLAEWNNKYEKSNEIQEILEEAVKIEKEQIDQEKKVQTLRKSYESAKKAYEEKNSEYNKKRTAFYDAQAGIIAKNLVEGMPCPVCGSKKHPNPCSLKKEYDNISRETVESLSAEVEKLDEIQKTEAQKTFSASSFLEEKQKQMNAVMLKLSNKIKENIRQTADNITLIKAKEIINEWADNIKLEGDEIRNKSEKLILIQNLLKDSEETKVMLQESISDINEKIGESKIILASIKSGADSLDAQKEYATKEDALKAINEALINKEKSEDEYNKSRKYFEEAKSDREKSEALIEGYQKLLPELEEKLKKAQQIYQKTAFERKMTDFKWKSITEKYEKSEISRLTELIEKYNLRKSKAEGAISAANNTIGEQSKPDIDKISISLNELEKVLSEARNKYDTLNDIYKTNSDILNMLQPKMTERSEIIRKFTLLESLYKRLSGKVTDGRMDIETLVQRYYLKNILNAANRRFRDMSAGQFELRMTDEAAASSGRNKGLDLMVYSNVTGTEREIRTLSGGESFMAALALALGLSDQIQESSASINLDMMFIDEGFGSLDDHSRSQAIKVLKHMAGNSRLIAIISHVTELKQQIEDKLIVEKNASGSSVKWELS